MAQPSILNESKNELKFSSRDTPHQLAIKPDDVTRNLGSFLKIIVGFPVFSIFTILGSTTVALALLINASESEKSKKTIIPTFVPNYMVGPVKDFVIYSGVFAFKKTMSENFAMYEFNEKAGKSPLLTYIESLKEQGMIKIRQNFQ